MDKPHNTPEERINRIKLHVERLQKKPKQMPHYDQENIIIHARYVVFIFVLLFVFCFMQLFNQHHIHGLKKSNTVYRDSCKYYRAQLQNAIK